MTTVAGGTLMDSDDQRNYVDVVGNSLILALLRPSKLLTFSSF